MTGSKYNEQTIYDFVDRKDHLDLGNNTLRGWIKRVLNPLRAGMPKLLEQAGSNPPIPPTICKLIEDAIESHKNPPKIINIIEELERTPSESREHVCLELLESARRLNKPFRYLGHEESLRAITIVEKAEESMTQIIIAIEKTFRLFLMECKNTAEQDVTNIIVQSIINLAEKFAPVTDQSPFAISKTANLPLNDLACRLLKEDDEKAQKYLGEFKEVCEKAKSNGDAKTTIRDLQELTQFLIMLLDWYKFDSPRYLGSALMEEGIETVRACFKESCHENSDFFDELGQTFFVLLWLANVFSIPTTGTVLMKRLKSG